MDLLASVTGEADSSSRFTVEPWRSKQARDHGRRSPWACFDELCDALFPHTARCREENLELLAAERTVIAGKEGTADRLAATKEDRTYTHACRKLAEKFYLGIDD